MQLKTIMDIASQWFQENTKKNNKLYIYLTVKVMTLIQKNIVQIIILVLQ